MTQRSSEARWLGFVVALFAALAMNGLGVAILSPHPLVVAWVLELLGAGFLVSVAVQLPQQVVEALEDFTGRGSKPALKPWLLAQMLDIVHYSAWAAVTVLAVWSALRLVPDLRWIGVWGALIAVHVLRATLFPATPRGRFGTTHAPDALTEEVRVLGEMAGVQPNATRVESSDSPAASFGASVSGMGRLATLVLSKELCGIPATQRRAVIAHELGHLQHRDVRWAALATGLAAGVDVLGLAVIGATDRTFALSAQHVGAFAFVTLFAGFLTAPAVAWFRRRQETAADRFALRLTGDPDAFIQALASISKDTVSTDPQSNLVFGRTHPPLLARIEMARAWQAEPQPR